MTASLPTACAMADGSQPPRSARLRNGGRITTDTLDRVRAFMMTHRAREGATRGAIIARDQRPSRSDALVARDPGSGVPAIVTPANVAREPTRDPARNFRFFDNR